MDILTLISGLLSGFSIIFWGYFLYNTKKIKLEWTIVPILIIYMFFFNYSIKTFSTLLNIEAITLSTLIIHQLIFKKSFSEICSGAFIINIVKFIVIFSLTLLIKGLNLEILFKDYWIGAIISNLLTTITITVNYKKYHKYIHRYDIYYNKSWKSIIIINLIIIIIFILEIPSSQEYYNYLIAIAIFYISYLFINIYHYIYQKITLDSYLTNYHEISKFSKLIEILIDNYKYKLYDTRNELTSLKEKIKKVDPLLIPYINALIEEKSHIDYAWLSPLSHFEIPGIKGFLSYKIQEMRHLKIEVEIFISDTLKDAVVNLSDDNLKDIYVIIGVFCDNAKEAAITSKEKTITIQAFYENNEIHLIIANTYKQKVSLNNIENIGVSKTKKGCGTGLYIVNTIIRKSNILKKKTTIMNDFFIQELILTTN